MKEEQSIFGQSKALINLSERNIDTLTGGDSFCYVFMTIDNTVGLQPLLIQKGKYHVFDITVRILDMEAFHVAADKGLLIDKGRYEQDFGPVSFLQRGTAKTLGTYPRLPADLKSKRFNVFISARNGVMEELIRLQRTPAGAWTVAMLVSASYYDRKPGIVLNLIDKQFPKESLKEDADWNNAIKLPVLNVQ